MKIANLLLSILFGAFAYLQLNDPDSLEWISLYLLIAALFGLAYFKKYYPILLIAMGLFCLAEMILTGPGVWDYFTNQEGYTIAEGMSYDRPYIEESREFFGAVIGLAGLGFLWWQSTRKGK